MYGIQTSTGADDSFPTFENDVKMYGIQTNNQCKGNATPFENDVKMYGIQTLDIFHEL